MGTNPTSWICVGYAVSSVGVSCNYVLAALVVALPVLCMG